MAKKKPASATPVKPVGPIAARLTPADWGRFYELLLTWPLREAAGKAIIPPPEERQPANWELQYEERHGDGRYEQRRKDMQRVLRRLAREGRADLRRVYQILRDARDEAIDAYRKGRGIDVTRPLVIRATRLLPDLTDALGQLRVFFESYSGSTIEDPNKVVPPEAIEAVRLLSAIATGDWRKQHEGWPEKWPELGHAATALRKILQGVPQPVALAEALGNAVQDAPLLTHTRAKAPRRPRIGTPAQPWLTRGRSRLREAGISLRQDREDLLAAVGLTNPDREKPSTKARP